MKAIQATSVVLLHTRYSLGSNPPIPSKSLLGAVAVQAGGANALPLFYVFHLSLLFGSLGPASFWVAEVKLS